jgi:threonine synthase
VLVASAVERGATSLVADSSGNAGSAIAAHAARADLPCTVFVPAEGSASKQRQIGAYGATVQVVAGDRTAGGEAAMAFVALTGASYASHVYDPMFLKGTKTFAYECWEQLGSAPEAVILPVGNGTLVVGATRGFRELLAAG